MKLRHLIKQYVTLKLSLGFRFRTEQRVLKGFDQAMGRITLGQVRPAAVRTYLDGSGPVTLYWLRKWGVLRGLYRSRWLVLGAPMSLTVACAQSGRPLHSVHLLASGAATAPRSHHPRTHQRGISQNRAHPAAVALWRRVALGRSAQTGTRRCGCPHAPATRAPKQVLQKSAGANRSKLTKVLADYLAERPAGAGARRHFLCANKGTSVSRATAERIFRVLRLAAEVKRPTGCRYQPRLHDLRHTMATHCLVNAYRTGADVQALLVNLSVYLGTSVSPALKNI